MGVAVAMAAGATNKIMGMRLNKPHCSFMEKAMNLREQVIDKKPLTHQCFHYHDDTREFTYVGAVWQNDEGGKWSAFCTSDVELYGHLGDFDDKDVALDCLKRRINGDKSAKGENA
jgi:hypothetical protein